MKQVFEVIINNVDERWKWTEAEVKEILQSMTYGETVEVKQVTSV